MLRFFLTAFLFVMCCVAPARAAPELARGTAILEPLVLGELDRGRFGLGRMLAPRSGEDRVLTSDLLFALPAMAPVRRAIDHDYAQYMQRHKSVRPADTIGVGGGFDLQVFDHALLYSADTRFVLAGIVNRMDRAYVSPEQCGEIRLVYRLTRMTPVSAGDDGASPRLPMTLNIVLNARGTRSSDGESDLPDCAELARRWLSAGDLSPGTPGLSERLTAADGPLGAVGPELIDRIEINLQVGHVPQSATREFRTDYLLKVFKYDGARGTFNEAVMENQIDRERLRADAELRREFAAWLLDPVHLSEFDRGVVLVPERFLATGAIAATPAGFSSSALQPAFGLVRGEGGAGPAAFDGDEIGEALKRAERLGVVLQNVRSPAGFERRLNDITCSGCHQTRGIGGFHVPGVDWQAAKPSNDSVVPASPHFFGDQVRRRDVLTAFRDGRTVDFSRGFASRPQTRGSSELSGTSYLDGWGAHCYRPRAAATENDRSFAGWTCASGLACEAAEPGSRLGMCFVDARGRSAASGTAPR